MRKGLFTLLILVISSLTTMAQQSVAEWQYNAYPNLPVSLDHLELDLVIDKSESLIEGEGRYSITSRRPGITEVVFNTADMEIRKISVNGNDSDFRVSSDSLIIQLPDTMNEGSTAEMVISWSSSSPYGVIKDVYGNMWTSLNPKARYHWLPILDHPEVETTIDARFTIPADEAVVFNGIKTGDEVISTDEKVVEYSSQTPTAVTGLSFAVGDFERVNARSGIKEVSFFASGNVLLPEVRDDLLSETVSAMKEYERALSFEFPYESLNVVVLPDHHWEEIQTGAGIIYLYQNLGSLSTQLKRGIAEQWFGNYHRFLNAPDNKYEFLKVMVTGTSDVQQLKNPDELQSVYRWNLWEQGADLLEDEYLKNVIRESLPELIKQYEGVTGWNEYADFWYDRSGEFWEVLPEFEVPEEESAEEYNYRVEYDYDEANASLRLIFEAEGEPVESLVGVDATEFGFSDTTSSEIVFTGAVDTVDVEISSGIDYLTLDLASDSDLNITLSEEKPFMFWIRQLRDPNKEDQIQAAVGLRDFTDNPDLQLALRDVLRDEEDSDVRAAMLETLSELTKDASGTEETFLSNLNSDDLSIQLSGLRALANYTDNDNVSYAVRNTLLRAERDTVFTTALNTYRQIAPAEDLLFAAEQFEQNEQGDKRAIQVLKVAAPEDTTRQSMTMADRFALGDYPYSIRKEALMLLMEFEDNEDYWMQTLEMLQEDRDPRIRFISLNAVSKLNSEDADNLLENRVEEELDSRVLRKIRELRN
ncbi:MAG: hypothetical protein WD053_02035 [Gracilimonas sp.]